MVQLKRVSQLKEWLHEENFNSSMVQLKRENRQQSKRLKRISIPLWYN